jgi:hypothetical protein
MKKTILTVLIGVIINMTSYAQSSFFLQGGPTFIKKVIIPHLEGGVQFNLNQLSFACETFDNQHNRWDVVGNHGRVKKSKVDNERGYYGSIIYGRILPVGNSNLSLVPNVSAGAAISSDVKLQYSGGISLQYAITTHWGLQTITNFPVSQNSKGDYHYPGVQTGILLQYSLF